MRQRTAFTPFFRVGGKSCVVGRLKRSWAVSFPNLVEVDTFSMSEGLRQHLLFYVTIQRCQEGGMDMGFHCGDNTDYQYRKPSWALGQEEILPSISTHNLQTKGWQQLHLQAIGSPYMGGQDFFLPQAPLRGFLHPEARLEGNMGRSLYIDAPSLNSCSFTCLCLIVLIFRLKPHFVYQS